jgi:hypothetical protein
MTNEIMKVSTLDAHDRLKEIKEQQSINVFQGADDCLKRNVLSLALQEKSPYIYIFAHPRTMPDGATKALYWQPRLSKPKAETNSYLFRCKSKTDLIEVCWILPPQELWGQYDKGKVTESEIIIWSIDQFVNNRAELEKPFEDDVSDYLGNEIYKKVRTELKRDNKLKILDPFNLKPFRRV